MGPRRSNRNKDRAVPYTTRRVGSKANKENEPLVKHRKIPVPDAGEDSPMDVDEIVLPPSQALSIPAETGNSPTPAAELTPRLVARPTDDRVVIARPHSTYEDLTDLESNGEYSLALLPSYGC
jgi:hypothetical protein